MQPMYSAEIRVEGRTKAIEVYHEDITRLDMPVDILGISAFWRHYRPTRGTLIGALKEKAGLDVEALAQAPAIDLRALCHVWLSAPTGHAIFRRIGCLELLELIGSQDALSLEDVVLKRISAYFTMLDLAANADIPMKVVALPLLGSGKQRVDGDLVITPLINECVHFLRRNAAVEKIIFVERAPDKAFKLATQLSQSYQLQRETAPEPAANGGQAMAFLSYNHNDAGVTRRLCDSMEQEGVRVWYAPRDIPSGDYASAIVSAIQRANCFIPLISRNSLVSNHVLNEINLAFNCQQPGRTIIPARLEDVELAPSFQYYLARYQWVELFRATPEQIARELVARMRQ